ncbi:hypothetical protein [Geoalkalibacter sp.]|uniref:hypothetical protein n=1 Tax=Geoalkalibacter sp. TaxID=3041440 RepID=UPI00272DD785|nr:hypothetical protein [Geoalkalibacter sp.]
MSVQPILDALRLGLEGSGVLQAFCRSRWNKPLAVRQTYRQRREIKLTDLPLILITRPAVTPDPTYGFREPEHTVRLYAGFYQPDADRGALELIAFEEAVAETVMGLDLGEPCLGVTIDQSRNDEGALAPSFFTIIDLSIKTSG